MNTGRTLKGSRKIDYKIQSKEKVVWVHMSFHGLVRYNGIR